MVLFSCSETSLVGSRRTTVSGSITTSSAVEKFGNAGVTVKSLSSDNDSIMIAGGSSWLVDGTTVTRKSVSGSREVCIADVSWNSFILRK